MYGEFKDTISAHTIPEHPGVIYINREKTWGQCVSVGFKAELARQLIADLQACLAEIEGK